MGGLNEHAYKVLHYRLPNELCITFVLIQFAFYEHDHHIIPVLQLLDLCLYKKYSYDKIKKVNLVSQNKDGPPLKAGHYSKLFYPQ
jgi:hypothetical protein